MKSVLLLAIFAVVAFAATEEVYQSEFTKWMAEHGKSYAPEEFFYRYEMFKNTYDSIEETNSQNLTWTAGLNAFSDLSHAEFKMLYATGVNTGLRRQAKNFADLKAPETYPTGSLDWVAKGAVTGVKNQGQCGSCWAFSTTGSMEGAIQIKYAHLTSLSEQELVDCAGSYGNHGCNGGLMDNAFKYAEANGLCTESAYPYKGVGGTCQKASCSASANTKLVGYKDVTHTENSLGAAVDIGPVSVAIEADQSGFQSYKSGVFCGVCGTNLDHGVLTVGYGTDSGSDYWKVKNSWGTTWGEQGYIRMCRNSDKCGIANEPSYPIA